VLRAVLFVATGVLFGASSLVMLAHPDFQHPVTLLDWFATLSLSSALLALAAALLGLARLVGGRRLYFAAALAATAAAVAGVANLFEDGLQQEWAFAPFISGTLMVEVGLSAMAVLMVLGSVTRVRLLALVPLMTAVDILALHSSGFGVAVGAAWAMAAAAAVRNKS
jgi:hypothetical protein